MNEHIRKAAWNLHRYDGMKGIVSLPAPIVGAILNRDTSKYQGLCLTASNLSGAVDCGTAQVWPTGGFAVCHYVLAVTPDSELDYIDYKEQVRHVYSRRKLAAPTIWRNGVQLTDIQQCNLIERMNSLYGELPEMALGKKGVL